MLSSFTVHADAHAVSSVPAPSECWGGALHHRGVEDRGHEAARQNRPL